MLKRLLSVTLALLMVISAAVIYTSAADTQTAQTGYTDKSKCLNFDNTKTKWAGPILFYIYELGGGELKPWGSKKLAGVDNGDGTWSFDPSSLGLESGKQYGLIMNDKASNAQTYDLIFDTSCLGDTAYVTDNRIESPSDSAKAVLEARWKNSKLGPYKRITSIGHVIGETIPSNTTAYMMMVNFLGNHYYNNANLDAVRRYSGKSDQMIIDDIGNGLGLTTSDVSKAINEAGVRVEWIPEKSSLPSGGSGGSSAYTSIPYLTVSNAEDGVKISWTKVSGASKYRVYYRGRNGWTRMADVWGNSYIDEDVYSGSSYTYTVRAISDDGSRFLSSFDGEGARITFVRAPSFSLSNAEDGVRISWPAVNGAAKYRIFYYGSKGWTRMVDTTSTSYIDTDVRSGNNYTYTVRCINSNGTAYTSDYRPGKKLQYITAPSFSLSNAKNGVRISWPSVRGAVKYRIYYYGRNGWTRMVDTTSTSYIDTDVRSGSNYTYTVRCINSDGTAFTSDYRAGKSIRYTPAK